MRAQRDGAAPKAAFVIDAPVAVPIEGADTLHAQGIIVTTLEEAAMVHPELVQRAFAAVRVDESKFVALWNALWRGGVFVYVPRGVEALVPVWIAHPASGSERRRRSRPPSSSSTRARRSRSSMPTRRRRDPPRSSATPW